MDTKRIIRAWKDRTFRAQLGAENDMLPEHPAGLRNLTDKELLLATGGGPRTWVRSACTGSDLGCCTIVIGECNPPPV